MAAKSTAKYTGWWAQPTLHRERLKHAREINRRFGSDGRFACLSGDAGFGADSHLGCAEGEWRLGSLRGNVPPDAVAPECDGRGRTTRVAQRAEPQRRGPREGRPCRRKKCPLPMGRV